LKRLIYKNIFAGEQIKITNKDEAIKLIKDLIENKLQWNDEDIKKKFSNNTLAQNGLQNAIEFFYQKNSHFDKKDITPVTYDIINTIYPNKFHPWDFDDQVPFYYWENKKNRIDAIKWLFEEKLNWSKEEIKNNATEQILKNNGFSDIYRYRQFPLLMQSVYPDLFTGEKKKGKGEIKEDQKQEAIEKTKNLIKNKLKWTEQDIKTKLNAEIFIENGLQDVLDLFDNNPVSVIRATYPNAFKNWQGPVIEQQKKQTKQNNIQKIRDMFDNELHWSDEEIKQNFNGSVMSKNGLDNILKIQFNGDFYKAFNAAYPNRFHPWEFQQMPGSFWKNSNNAQEAVKWLFEQKLGWSKEEIQSNASIQTLIDNGFGYLVRNVYHNDINKVLQQVYPDLINTQLEKASKIKRLMKKI